MAKKMGIVMVVVLTLILSVGLYAQDGKGRGRGPGGGNFKGGNGDSRPRSMDDFAKKNGFKNADDMKSRWNNMTPEQKQKLKDAKEQYFGDNDNCDDEDKDGNSDLKHDDEFWGEIKKHKKEVENKISNLSPEQRDKFWSELKKYKDDIKDQLGKLSSNDDKRKFMSNVFDQIISHIKAKRDNSGSNDDDSKTKIQARGEDMENKLRNMSPEERRQYIMKMKNERESRRLKDGDDDNSKEDNNTQTGSSGDEITPEDILPPVSKESDGLGNGVDAQPSGNPPVNDRSGAGPGNPGNKGGADNGNSDNCKDKE